MNKPKPIIRLRALDVPNNYYDDTNDNNNNIINNNNNNNTSTLKPPLDTLINLAFPMATRNNALALFRIFEKIPNMNWGENGDLLYPINNYNILDIIDNMISVKKVIPSIYLDDYKYLIQTTNFPMSLIKNTSLKEYISLGMILVNKRKSLSSSRMLLRPKRKKKMLGAGHVKWIPY